MRPWRRRHLEATSFPAVTIVVVNTGMSEPGRFLANTTHSARLREFYNASHIFSATAFGTLVSIGTVFRRLFHAAMDGHDLSLYDQRPLLGHWNVWWISIC